MASALLLFQHRHGWSNTPRFAVCESSDGMFPEKKGGGGLIRDMAKKKKAVDDP